MRRYLQGCRPTDFPWAWGKTLRAILDIYHPKLVVEAVQRAAQEAEDDPVKEELEKTLEDEGRES